MRNSITWLRVALVAERSHSAGQSTQMMATNDDDDDDLTPFVPQLADWSAQRNRSPAAEAETETETIGRARGKQQRQQSK